MQDLLEKLEDQFTKYEIARILGARSLQIAMDAPLLLKISPEELEAINYNPIEIAKRELIAEVLPITVNRPLPKKKLDIIKKLSKEEIEALKKKEKEREKVEEEKLKGKGEISKEEEEKGKKKREEIEEEAVSEETKETEGAEIMELATPEDEVEESSSSSGEEEGI